ncbi:fibronectin type III domain-containing protein [Gabonibacter chumensis]|uniref:fibronectin type III domain-containing protein n=1 Tax=Gabonibacter chumensis TaxID=2972474 RepID=UPI0025742321|nr:fibronectin type III domain-containing protein [Gabonibacter chumensis]MCR9012058.1 fibronectin type III domain-containing protein [Gabonibacter chumensis]
MKTKKFFIVLILVLVSNFTYAIGDGKVTLIITPPKSEGTGGPFLHYRIEYRKFQEKRWEEVKEKPEVKKDGNGNYVKQEFEVKDLEENESYVFRVMVVNKMGPGAPGPESRKAIAKKDNPEKVEVQCGEPLGGRTNLSFAELSTLSFASQAQSMKLFYRKEE